MTSFLTVGRRPAREYKRRMRLSDAYAKLEWNVPIVHERATMVQHRRFTPPVPRGIGTSAHMLIELYLDMQKSTTSHRGRAGFLVECLSSEQGTYLRKWLETIHEAVDLDVDLDQVRFWPRDRDPSRLRGDHWFSWALFCDHAVKEGLWPEVDRNMGPYGLVRRLEPTEEFASAAKGDVNWRAYDRDDRFLGLLTAEGKQEVMDMATCPITLGGRRPTTYPATTFASAIDVRLRKAFER